MNADRLLANFDTLVDTPGAVPRLRRFILDLAVRGKLVPQDPNDEPALALLSRIASEKRRLADAGEIRRQKPRWEASSRVDMPFSLPAGWAWSRVAKIGVLNPRNSAPDDSQASFVPMAMIASEYGVPHRHEVRRWAEIKSGYTHFAEGDVGVAKITPCFENGKSTIFGNLAGGMGSGTTELHVVRPLFVDPRYVILFFKSSYFIEPGIPKMTGTAGQKRVPATYWANAPFPLPPLAEQHRIVAKVDELMSLCDRLLAEIVEREATRRRYAIASLARLEVSERDPVPVHTASAIDNLRAITTRSDHIENLRRTITNLAVSGKLVPQCASEGDGASLLSEIGSARSQRIQDQLRYRKGQLQGRSEGHGTTDLDLPINWAEVRLGQAVDLVNGRAFKPSDWTQSGLPIDRIQNLNNPAANFNRYDGDVRSKFLIDNGDFLISWSGTPGTSFGAHIWQGGPAILNQHIFKAVLVAEAFEPQFLKLAINSRMTDLIKQAHGGVGLQHITKPKLQSIFLALPPLAEQRRIVARLDEMITLCDRLEAHLVAAEDARVRALDAMLHEALGPNTGCRDAAGINGRVT